MSRLAYDTKLDAFRHFGSNIYLQSHQKHHLQENIHSLLTQIAQHILLYCCKNEQDVRHQTKHQYILYNPLHQLLNIIDNFMAHFML
jgi:hypothetical protein